MDASMPSFAVYELVQVDTGVPLYQTHAQAHEIQTANDNLRRSGLSSRFFPAGTFQAPCLHGLHG